MCVYGPIYIRMKTGVKVSFVARLTDLVIKCPFSNKVCSEILDYALHYDLLQFHYD